MFTRGYSSSNNTIFLQNFQSHQCAALTHALDREGPGRMSQTPVTWLFAAPKWRTCSSCVYMMNKWIPSGEHTKNNGKSPCYSWENPLFRLGHFPLQTVSSPEGNNFNHVNICELFEYMMWFSIMWRKIPTAMWITWPIFVSADLDP